MCHRRSSNAKRTAQRKGGVYKRNASNTFTIYTQNVRGADDDTVQEVVASMQKESVEVFCMQETWRRGDNQYQLSGHTVFEHGAPIGGGSGGILYARNMA